MIYLNIVVFAISSSLVVFFGMSGEVMEASINAGFAAANLGVILLEA